MSFLHLAAEKKASLSILGPSYFVKALGRYQVNVVLLKRLIKQVTPIHNERNDIGKRQWQL